MKQQTRSARTAAFAIAVAVVLLLGGCTFAHHDGQGHRSSRTPAPTKKHTFRLAASGSVNVEVPTQPMATVPTRTEGLQFELYLLKRSGSAVDVVFALHNTSAKSIDMKAATAGMDADPGSDSAVDAHHVSNVSLVDPKGLKQYLTFLQNPKDEQSQCLCSQINNSFEDNLQPGARRYGMSEVAAPPPDVTKVTVLAEIASVPDATITR